MIYINFSKRISSRARNPFSSRTGVFLDMFEEARIIALAKNDSVSLVGYCYKSDLDYILKHVSCIDYSSIDTDKDRYFCKFIVTKETKIS